MDQKEIPHREIRINDDIVLQFEDSDFADEYASYVRENHEYLKASAVQWSKPDYSEADATKYLLEEKEKRLKGDAFVFAMYDKGVFVCMMDIRNILGAAHGPEIGYWVRQEHSGKGYATLGAKALMKFGFKVLGVKRIVLETLRTNIASQRVAEKAGFVLLPESKQKKDCKFILFEAARS